MPDAALHPHQAPTPPWIQEFEYKPHPAGHAGILASLDAVRQGILAGKLHPDVNSWVDETLIAAQNPRGHLARAEALYEGMRRQNFWKPDPRGVERVAGAHLVLGDGKSPPKMKGIDCDEQVVALGAACENAGIPTAIVGAAYDDGKHISHVLLMVSDGKGEWYYADPSADWAFGQAKTATREYVIDTQTGQVLCDGTSCSVPLQGKKPPDEGPGMFLRLGADPHVFAPPGVLSGHMPVHVPHMLGAPASELGAEVKEMLGDARDSIIRHWKASRAMFDAAQAALASLGLPLLGSPDNSYFGIDSLQRFGDLYKMSGFAVDVIQEAIDGRRLVGIVEGGADIVIERLPSDTVYLGFDSKGPQLFSVADNKVVHGSLGAAPLLIPLAIGAVKVIAVGLSVAASVGAAAWALVERAKADVAKETIKAEAEAIKNGKTAELERIYAARKGLVQAEGANGVGAQVAQAVDSLTRFFTLLGKGALVVLGLYGAKKGVDYAKAKRWIG